MVNHIRTLLLNRSQSDLSSMGLPYGSPWYVSPRFSAIRIPDRVLPVHDALFHGTTSLDDRVGRVNAVMSLLNAVDIGQFLSVFDARTTVSSDGGSFSVRGLFDRASEASSGFERRVIDAARSVPGLFSFSGDRDIDSALSGLRGLAYGSFEFNLRVAAIVLAYCIQLERERNV